MSSTPAPAPDKRPSSNPLFGCIIILIIILTFSGMVGWVFYSGYKQNQEIDKFTVNEPTPFEEIQISEPQKQSLKEKLQKFEATIQEGQAAELALSIEELNHLLVLTHEAEVVDYREVVRFTGFKPEESLIEAKLHWPMNRLTLDESNKRYLIGEGDFWIYLDESKALELLIKEVRVPGKDISKGFIGSLRQWPWLNLAKTKDNLSTVFKRITEITFSEDGKQLILRAAEAPKKDA